MTLAMGIAFLWHTRRQMYKAPDTIPEEMLRTEPEKANA